jgi:hypothetical protein
MIQRKFAFSLAGLFVVVLPATGAAAPAAPAASGSNAPATVSTKPVAVNVNAATTVEAAQEPKVTGPAAPDHVRGGGFFRLGLGAGAFLAVEKIDARRRVAGQNVALASDLSIGATLMRGLAVGASAYGTVVASPTDPSRPSFVLLACPFVDVYPDPAKGFHVVGGPCYAAVRFEIFDGMRQGWGLNAGIGYEWSALWGSNLGRGWSVGMLARLQYAEPIRELTVGGITPALLMTATWY